MTDVLDPRDVARLRTQVRVIELACVELLAEIGAALERDRPAAEVLLALRTAREFLERAQVALAAALERLPQRP